MNVPNRRTYRQKSSVHISEFTLPNTETRLGEAVTDVLSILSEQGSARWGLLQPVLMHQGDLQERAANIRMKQLVKMGLVQTKKIDDKASVTLTIIGEWVLETRKLGLNVAIPFRYRAKQSKFLTEVEYTTHEAHTRSREHVQYINAPHTALRGQSATVRALACQLSLG